VLLDAPEDFVGNAPVGFDLLLQRLGEELVAIAAARLGTVERNIAVDQQAARIDLDASLDGEPDARPEAAQMPLERHGLPDLGDGPLCQ
jgi:hypothetical protein